jgi:predicted nucleic acid-binding protein
VIVLDASTLIALLLDLAAAPIHARLRGERANAPHLIDLEVIQTLRRLQRAGQLSDWRAQAALHDLGAMPLQRYPHQPLLPRIWQYRHLLTAYDAAYLSLAETLGCGLLTRDRALAATARSRVPVELL